MKVQAKNYVAKAHKKITFAFFEGKDREDFGNFRDDYLYWTEGIEDAIHFSLPDDGNLLGGLLSSVREDESLIRLPFSEMTLEFDHRFKEDDTYSISGRSRTVKPGDIQYSIVIYAKEYYRPKTSDKDEGCVIFLHAWRKDPLLARWEFIPRTIMLPDRWSRLDFRTGRDFGLRIPLLLSPRFWVSDEYEWLSNKVENWEFIHYCAWTVLEFVEALSCSNVSHEVIQHADQKVNARRVKAKKLPLLETRCLTITVPGNKTYRVEDSDGDGDHERNSPRQHLRRGHIRRLSDDRRIWVNSCIVGDPSKGRIEKSYAVRSAA